MNKILEVILKLNDQFTAPLRKSETGLSGFASGIGKMVAQWASFAAISAAVVVAVDKAFVAFDAYRASLVKLDGAARITGISLQTLTTISEKAQRQFGLSKTQAADFAVEMAKLASKAGDVGQAGPALQKFLDIGAARGLTAAQTLTAVQQSILGIDEGTDKLFNKNPSVLYAEFAEKIGTTAGKLSDQQKAQALVNAAFEDGSKVTGKYGEYLLSTAGQAEQTANKTQVLFARLGEFLDPVRRVWIGFKDALVNIAAVAVFTMEAIGTTAVAVMQSSWQFVQGLVGAGANLLGSFLHLVAKVAGPLKDELDAVSVRLVTWGETAKKSSAANLRETASTWKARIAEIYGVASQGEEDITAATKKGTAQRTALETAAAAKHKTIVMTKAEIEAEAARQTSAAWGFAYDYVIQQVNRVLAAQKTGSKVAKASWDTIIDGIDGVYGSSVKTAGAIEKVDNNTANAARGAISLAREFGAIDDNSASVLNNVVNLAETLSKVGSKVGAGDIVSIIGSAVGILNGLFNGNPAHMALIRKNSDALMALTRSNGLLLRSQSTGAQVEAIKQALPGLEAIAGVQGNGVVGKNRFNSFRGILESLGLTITDAEQIAKDTGIDLGISNGSISQAGIQAFIDAIKTANFGQFGQGFAEQQDFLSRYFDVAGITDPATQAAMIADKLGKDSPFLAELVSRFDLSSEQGRKDLREAFAGILTQLNAGTFTGSFGNLTGSDFVDFIGSFTDLIGGIGTGFGAGGTGGGGGTGVTGASFNAVTFSAGTYDLGFSLFDPMARIDVNISGIRLGVDTLVEQMDRLIDRASVTAAASVATAEAVASGNLAATVGVQTADSYALTGLNTGRV